LSSYGYKVHVVVWPEDYKEHYDMADWIKENPNSDYDDLYQFTTLYTKSIVAPIKAIEDTLSDEWHDYFDSILDIYSYEYIGTELFGADIIDQPNGDIRYDNADLGNLDISTDTGLWLSRRDQHIKGRGVLSLLQFRVVVVSRMA